MGLKVFNSLTRKKEDFSPAEKGKVRMYVCGPTVYAPAHIGHARSAVSFDVIYRYLQYSGLDVTYARNYTD
ncbi:MAG: class I tRNA ligase family protein, partial [Thermodesulfobacteriota bacterium]